MKLYSGTLQDEMRRVADIELMGHAEKIMREGADEIERLSEHKRPVMWRVMDDNVWRVFSDEKEAADCAEKIGSQYQGLYVRTGWQK